MINFRMMNHLKKKCDSCDNTRSYTPLAKNTPLVKNSPLIKNTPYMSYNEIFKQLNDKVKIKIEYSSDNNDCKHC